MSISLSDFEKRISDKKFTIAVVGLGYVGLPLALEFAGKGLSVIGIEADKDRLALLKKRQSYITDISDRELSGASIKETFCATGSFSVLKEADVVIICVPTPLKRKYHPNIKYIKQAVRSISRYLKVPSLIILESTTYPGTTEEVILPLLQRSGLEHGKDFFLSFSPERIDPGNKEFPVNRIAKIVGGVSPLATKLAAAVYGNIIERIVPVSSSRVAEFVKLLENTYRLINIGMIDELAMMAHKMGIDIWEVIDAAKTKPFGFMPFYPGPGVGGHCIPKDPLYLYWKARHHGFRSRFIKLASDTISFMPEYVTHRVMEILGRQAKAKTQKLKILIVGVTYKKDIKDLRQSPPLDIIDCFHKQAQDVSYYDPLIPYLKIHSINLKSIELDKEKLAQFDCVVIATDHSEVDYDFLLKNSKLIFDCRNVYKGVADKKVERL